MSFQNQKIFLSLLIVQLRKVASIDDFMYYRIISEGNKTQKPETKSAIPPFIYSLTCHPQSFSQLTLQIFHCSFGVNPS